eukprot:659900-Rhodomonas_salina.1
MDGGWSFAVGVWALTLAFATHCLCPGLTACAYPKQASCRCSAHADVHSRHSRHSAQAFRHTEG